MKLTFALQEIPLTEEYLSFIKKIRTHPYHVRLRENTQVLYLQEGQVVVAPWQICTVIDFPESMFDDYIKHNRFYWSSLTENVSRAKEARIFPYCMRAENKSFSAGNMLAGGTNIAFRIQVSDYSLKRMKSHRKEEEYVHTWQRKGETIKETRTRKEYLCTWWQGSENHVWFTDSLFFKLVSDKIMFEHELLIYRQELPFMPKLVDFWSHESEHFICTEAKGDSLTSLYGVEKLIPEEIKIKKNQVQTKMTEAGLVFGDPHLGNFVQDKQGEIYAIDAESIYFASDGKLVMESDNLEQVLETSKTGESKEYLTYLWKALK